jgi:hypothetical protein
MKRREKKARMWGEWQRIEEEEKIVIVSPIVIASR